MSKQIVIQDLINIRARLYDDVKEFSEYVSEGAVFNGEPEFLALRRREMASVNEALITLRSRKGMK